ncbi:Heat shock transcription factor [Coemansia sp. RSA 1199]|nr:Heat shock transcription factor [Coemansia sp. RSA 1199]
MPRSPSKFSAVSNSRKKIQVSSANKNTFVYVLHDLTTNKNVQGIKWSDDGKSFIVYKSEFIKNVLSQKFDTDKYTSFTRQHYIYNFTKLTDGRKDKNLKGVSIYKHKYFQRDRPDLLRHIKRVQNPKKASETHDQGSKTERIRQRSLGKESNSSQVTSTPVTSAIDEPMLDTDTATSTAASVFTTVPKGEVLPVQSISSTGIAYADPTISLPPPATNSESSISPSVVKACSKFKEVLDYFDTMNYDDISHQTERLRIQDMPIPLTPGVPPGSIGMVLDSSTSPLSPIAEHTSVSYIGTHPGLTLSSQQPSAYYLSGADFYSVAPPSAPILNNSPPMGSSSDSSPSTIMTTMPAPLMTAPVASNFPLLYPLSTERQQSHTHSLNISGFDMINTMPFGSVGTDMPSITAGTGVRFMHTGAPNATTAPGDINFNIPRSASTSAHSRVVSTPTNIFYGNLQGPF